MWRDEIKLAVQELGELQFIELLDSLYLQCFGGCSRLSTAVLLLHSASISQPVDSVEEYLQQCSAMDYWDDVVALDDRVNMLASAVVQHAAEEKLCLQ